MATSVAELTPAELRAIIAEVVREQLVDLLGDPDEGLEVRPELVRLVEERVAQLDAGGRTVSLEEAFDELEDR